MRRLLLILFISVGYFTTLTAGTECHREVSCEEERVERRPIKSEYTAEWGWTRYKSTYLSPLPYSGHGIALAGRWSKVFNHFDGKANMAFDARITLAETLNPAKTAAMDGATVDLGWGLAWHPHISSNWDFTLGGRIGIYAGALYLNRNSNNPVTAIAAPGLDITASAAYSFHIGRLPISISDHISIPSLSIFFCPQFGETYYEIYLGNRKGLVHCGWWGNAAAADNHFQAKLHFGRRAMLLGWHLEYRSWNANHISTSIRQSSLTIGLEF